MAGLKVSSEPAVPVPSTRSQIGVDWFAFFLADVQTGFGPFLAVYLTTEKWTNGDIGFVLTAGSIVALLGQLPGGALVDALKRERLLAGLSMVAIGISALWIAVSPQFTSVLFSQVLHSAASVIVGPALAAISLELVGHRLIGERLGRNARFSSSGSLIAAAIMGAFGHYFSSRAVFFVTAAMAIPAILALRLVSEKEFHREELEPDVPRPRPEYNFGEALAELAGHRTLLILAATVCLFHLSNAAILPLVANVITLRTADNATELVALFIIVPQLVVALVSPWVGRYADHRGRRPLLLVGFGALPVRAALLASSSDPTVLVAIQVLDGLSAAALGVLVSGCVADITRHTGNFNLALGFVGVAMGIGGTISTAAAGLIADRFGTVTSLLTLACVGLLAFVSFAFAMPETRDPNGALPPDKTTQ
jgi:MFS family permease